MTRVIRVVDFETAGEEPPAAVVEAGVCELTETPDGWTVGTPSSRLCGADRIPCEARAIHHISPREVASEHPFYAQLFVDGSREMGAVALAAHNAAFEAQWLGPVLGDLPLLCTYKAALRVWPDAPAHKNQVLRYWLEEQGIGDVDPALAQPAHRAGPDAYVTAYLLKHLLAHASVEDMIAWTAEPALMPRMPIGKQRGAKWSEVDEGFLGWMLRQATMDHDLKWNAQRELDRRRSEPLHRTP